MSEGRGTFHFRSCVAGSVFSFRSVLGKYIHGVMMEEEVCMALGVEREKNVLVSLFTRRLI